MTKEQTNWDKVYDWIKEYNRENEDGECDAFTDKPHRAYRDVADYVVDLISQEKEKMIEWVKENKFYLPGWNYGDGGDVVSVDELLNLLKNK
ncbi:MAG: hypothetical protein ACP5N7_07270 [Candidatus Pacearchaeota archaeon]